ncbi:unnamed protein product [Rotaria sp. Silwood2]|nr:unnamed protein product [Rotaria sp. Silwood2]CAF2553639.1 unnamed protein product [Rotaria sp. Silwood2]CAF2961320.1 unnamed protein product [Rotaria sp. Silwood2]CAF3906079.1 unnamed protein product [Rotaria sp. Silwood2]CAF4018669.1 unnamed protein product [Rotaria sp. Silwood2]
MGIRGLQTFIEQKLSLLHDIELHNCNVLFDGNSIYHQMYKECHLTCLFGGEYDKFYRYCKQLFESFRICQINVIVVFDGARLDDRKLSTVLERSQRRVDYSTQTSVNIDLSPLLLRQTFINVLDEMNIPYISALGEGDDECVSLANHLDCYLIARDSDYYCYNLSKGYVPFDYVDINPIEKNSYYYLSAQLFTIDSLLEKFVGLNHSTLSLAFCLCGNDYINGNTLEPILNHISTTVEKSEKNKISKNNKTKHWFVLQWMRHFDDVEIALEKLLQPIAKTLKKKTEMQLRLALQSYINPSDTLIYRFALLKNENLLKNAYFAQLAREYLDKLDMNDEQIRIHIENTLSEIKSKNNCPIPAFLLDSLTDLHLSITFIEILIHRSFICAAHVELEREPSIFVDAIPIVLPCLAILLKWDNEEDDKNIILYHRVLKQLKRCKYDLTDYDEVIDLNYLNSLSTMERQDFVSKCLKMSSTQREQYNHIHTDYHFWLMSIRYWYSIRHLTPVYLYAIIISLIKSIHLINTDTFQSEDIEPLTISINDNRNHTQIDPIIRRTIALKLNEMSKKVYDFKKFDCSIIHEFNCLQTIFMYSTHVNEFLNRPFSYEIFPHHFLCGSFFYAFVEHYETKKNLSDALSNLFQKETKLLKIIDNLFMTITSDIDY